MRINVNVVASRLLMAATIAAWVVLLLGLFIPVPQVWDRLVLAVAGVGGVAVIRQATRRSVEEVFDAGRDYQRRLDMKVYNLPQRRPEDSDKVVNLR